MRSWRMACSPSWERTTITWPRSAARPRRASERPQGSSRRLLERIGAAMTCGRRSPRRRRSRAGRRTRRSRSATPCRRRWLSARAMPPAIRTHADRDIERAASRLESPAPGPETSVRAALEHAVPARERHPQHRNRGMTLYAHVPSEIPRRDEGDREGRPGSAIATRGRQRRTPRARATPGRRHRLQAHELHASRRGGARGSGARGRNLLPPGHARRRRAARRDQGA